MNSSKRKTFFHQNYQALIIAVLVGLIMILPQLELISELADRYAGLAITETDNDDFYYSRIRDAYDGKWAIDNPRIYNPENTRGVIPPLPEITAAAFARISGVPVAALAVVGNFIFPAFLYLILYFLFSAISQRRPLALVAPLAIILASNLAYFLPETLQLVTDPSGLTRSVYNRPIHPQISSLYFFGFLLVFFWFLKKRTNLLLIASGLLYGLLFYSYLFSWTLVSVILGLYLIHTLWQRDFKRAVQLGLILGIGFIVAIPYWINYFAVSSLPIYEALQKRFGFYESRSPFFSKYLFVDLLLIGGLAWLQKSFGERHRFLLIYVLAGFLVINQQVVTGLRFFPGHYHWYKIVPVSIFIILWFLYYVIERRGAQWLLTGFLGAVAVIVVFNGVASQHYYYVSERELYTDLQRYGAVYDWINHNVDADSVVLAEGKLSDKLTVFTSTYSYLPHRTDRQYIIPQAYFRHTYFVNLVLEGRVDPENDIQPDDYPLMWTLFGYYNLYRYDCLGCFSSEEIQQLRQDYETFLGGNFAENFKRYKVDYALWDTQSDSRWNLDQYDFMLPLTEINGVRIYQVE